MLDMTEKLAPLAFMLPEWGPEVSLAGFPGHIFTHRPIIADVRCLFISAEFALTMRCSCQHFVRYEGAMTVIGTQIAGFIMFLR